MLVGYCVLCLLGLFVFVLFVVLRVVCCLMVGVRCSWFVLRGSLGVVIVCCVVFDDCCVVFVVCCLMVAARCVLFVVCCLLLGVRCLLVVVRCVVSEVC